MKIRNLFLTALAALTMSQANAIETLVRADQTPGVATQKDYMIGNGHFEKNIGNWKSYADAAATTPVDGTGGSPTVTCTRTTSSPLSGLGSLLITKGATNRQGDGCSSAFPIDSTDQAKVIAVEFEYAIPSGTFNAGATGVDSDLEFWIYDITNSTLIPLSTYKAYSNASSPSASFSGYFQSASNSTSYRLIAHVATTNASAWTFKADNFKIYRSKYVYGTPITDSTTFTPALSAVTTPPTLGSGSQQSGTYRRLGDSLEVWEEIVFGTSGVSAGSGIYRLTLPNGYVVDTTKLPSTAVRGYVGHAFMLTAGTIHDGCGVEITGTNPGYVTLICANQQVASSTPGVWTTSDFLKAHFIVPIVGWSSSVQMSDLAPQADVAATANAGQIPTGTLNTSYNVAKFATISKDSTGSYDPSTGLFTAKVPGWFFASGVTEVTYASATVASVVQAGIGLNGTIKCPNAAVEQATTVLRLQVPASCLVYANAGDTIGFYVGTTTTTPTYTNNVTGSTFGVFRLGGPVTIGATETVAFSVYFASNTTGINPNNSSVKLIYTTKQTDTHGIYNTSTGVATIQTAGRYQCAAKVDLTGPNVLANTYVNQLVITASGVTTAYRLDNRTGAVSTALVLNGTSPVIPLLPGDTIEQDLFGAGNNSASTVTATGTLGNSGYLSCYRVGL